jgi:hypothetical protein
MIKNFSQRRVPSFLRHGKAFNKSPLQDVLRPKMLRVRELENLDADVEIACFCLVVCNESWGMRASSTGCLADSSLRRPKRLSFLHCCCSNETRFSRKPGYFVAIAVTQDSASSCASSHIDCSTLIMSLKDCRDFIACCASFLKQRESSVLRCTTALAFSSPAFFIVLNWNLGLQVPALYILTFICSARGSYWLLCGLLTSDT